MYDNFLVRLKAAHTEPIARQRAWFVIIFSIVAVVLVEHIWPGNGLSAVFILITCGGSWILGGRAGYLIAAMTALAVAVSDDFAGLPFWDQAAKSGVRIATLLLVAAMVSNFRRAFDRAHYLSEHDRMTGALNKEIFEKRARALLKITARTRDTLLLAILDLDDFKTLNTRYGHAAGDKVLREFSNGAARIIPRGGHFGRVGGDEFALLLQLGANDNGPDIATLLHTRLSAALADSGYPVTCSMGVLLIPTDLAKDEAALLHTVDRLMYDVKMAGKNAVKIGRAQAEVSEQSPPMTTERHAGQPMSACKP